MTGSAKYNLLTMKLLKISEWCMSLHRTFLGKRVCGNSRKDSDLTIQPNQLALESRFIKYVSQLAEYVSRHGIKKSTPVRTD